MSDRDAELAQRLAQGDADALKELMTLYETPLYSYLAALTRDPSAAEDLYSRTWLKVWQAAPRYKESGRFKAWLFTAARRLAFDHLALKRTKLSAPLEEPDRLFSPAPEPERELLSRETGARIDAALAALPEEQREVFLLKEHGGLTFAEIADAQDAPLGTVLARMHRAVLKLRKSLEDLDARR